MKVYACWDGMEVSAHEDWEVTSHLSLWLFTCPREGWTSIAVVHYKNDFGWGYWLGDMYYPLSEIAARLLLQGTPGEAREWARGKQR